MLLRRSLLLPVGLRGALHLLDRGGWGWETAVSGPIFFSQGPFQTDQGSHSPPQSAPQGCNSRGHKVESGPKKRRYTVRYRGNARPLLGFNPVDDL